MANNKITHIGKYEVIETIGRGGMGLVYKANDPLLGRIVAIKTMTGGFAEDPELLKRFYREAKSTASLRHPNIVTVYDVGDQEGEPYLVMEFLDGESLDAIISSQRELSLLEKINYIVQVCNGLQYAHERNLIHRDIKPANIMVQREGPVKLVDFGIARMGDDHVTRPGQVMGSIHYMSPEQIRESDVDARTDLFATGTVLYQLLTYNLPFKANDVPATLFKILHDAPPPLSRYLMSYPSDLDAILERALAKESGDRYQTADEFAFDLTQVQLQLKAGLVAELLEKADISNEQGGLTAAREHLLELLKLDPQNRSANERMRILQKSIQDRRRAGQVEQLRKEAEEAGRGQQFDEALRSIEHAISLDQTNAELVSIRDDLNRAKLRKMPNNKNLLELTPPQGQAVPEQLRQDVPPQTLSEAQTYVSAKTESRSKSPSAPESSLTNTASPTSLKQADIDHAAHLLARYLGPIAGVLAKRAAQRATDLRTLYGLLADNCENETERARFLRDSGFSDL